METMAACCIGCVRSALLPWPFPSMAAHFPWGISHTTSALSPLTEPPTPKAAELLDRPFSIKTIHTHLLRGLEVIIPARTWPAGLQPWSPTPHSRGERSTVKKIYSSHFPSSYHCYQNKAFFLEWSLRTQVVLIFLTLSGCSVMWLLWRQKEREFPVASVRISVLPAASSGPKGITRPSSICFHIPQ